MLERSNVSQLIFVIAVGIMISGIALHLIRHLRRRSSSHLERRPSAKLGTALIAVSFAIFGLHRLVESNPASGALLIACSIGMIVYMALGQRK
jgi:hypothetical protein